MPEILQREVYYPESDGRPLAESDFHFEVIIDLIHALRTHYAGQPDVYVTGNLLLYYVEGDPRKSISPDVLVTWGDPQGAPEDVSPLEGGARSGLRHRGHLGHHPGRKISERRRISICSWASRSTSFSIPWGTISIRAFRGIAWCWAGTSPSRSSPTAPC